MRMSPVRMATTVMTMIGNEDDNGGNVRMMIAMAGRARMLMVILAMSVMMGALMLLAMLSCDDVDHEG